MLKFASCFVATVINGARAYDREVDRIIREDLDVCEGCGEVVNKRRKPKTCPSCGGEFDW